MKNLILTALGKLQTRIDHYNKHLGSKAHPLEQSAIAALVSFSDDITKKLESARDEDELRRIFGEVLDKIGLYTQSSILYVDKIVIENLPYENKGWFGGIEKGVRPTEVKKSCKLDLLVSLEGIERTMRAELESYDTREAKKRAAAESPGRSPKKRRRQDEPDLNQQILEEMRKQSEEMRAQNRLLEESLRTEKKKTREYHDELVSLRSEVVSLREQSQRGPAPQPSFSLGYQLTQDDRIISKVISGTRKAIIQQLVPLAKSSNMAIKQVGSKWIARLLKDFLLPLPASGEITKEIKAISTNSASEMALLTGCMEIIEKSSETEDEYTRENKKVKEYLKRNVKPNETEMGVVYKAFRDLYRTGNFLPNDPVQSEAFARLAIEENNKLVKPSSPRAMQT